MRRALALVAVSAAALGFLVRCELERRLRRLRERHGEQFARLAERNARVLLPDIPHTFDPANCWCGDLGDPVHQADGNRHATGTETGR